MVKIFNLFQFKFNIVVYLELFESLLEENTHITYWRSYREEFKCLLPFYQTVNSLNWRSFWWIWIASILHWTNHLFPLRFIRLNLDIRNNFWFIFSLCMSDWFWLIRLIWLIGLILHFGFNLHIGLILLIQFDRWIIFYSLISVVRVLYIIYAWCKIFVLICLANWVSWILNVFTKTFWNDYIHILAIDINLIILSFLISLIHRGATCAFITQLLIGIDISITKYVIRICVLMTHLS